MTNQRSQVLSCLLSALALTTSCGAFESKSCTEMGCIDGVTLVLQTRDGAPHPYQLTLLADDALIRCELPSLDQSVATSCTNPSVQVSMQEQADCVETRTADAISESCTLNGKFQQLLVLQQTPTCLEVTATDANGATIQETFDVEYTLSFPNGRDCGPACLNSRIEWVVP